MNVILLFLCALLLANIILIHRKVEELNKRITNLHGRFKALVSTVDDTEDRLRKRVSIAEDDIKAIKQSIAGLEKGLVPDYEAAKKANDAVNDFSKGIAGILGFDPFAALHKDEPQEE